MNPVILHSLDQIRTGYSVFEKDQVLTHDQLNTVAEYFDDQTRLTRVKLLGVGIVCGLRVSVKEANVTVSKGAGVTTDGDLLYFAADTVFDQFKLYDASNPKYEPMLAALGTKKVYELMPKVATALRDPRAIGQSRFGAETGLSLDQMAAVLFMEGYVKDEDLCTGTDCDNRGQNLVNTMRLLLVQKAVAGSLHKKLPASDQAARLLVEIVADRPLFSSTVNSTVRLASVYRTACQSIHRKLAAEIPKVYPNCSALLGEAFASDPASGWMAKLQRLAVFFGANDAGIQYYYDFLKDLVETYNHFRQLLFSDTTWCCPGPESFPKHLLLGNVVAGADPEENRTGFYPSPLASRTVERLRHAVFLAQKLDALIQAFQSPGSGAIRITPSRFEDASLEERAIPYYYQILPERPIQKQWNYRLHQQGMDAWNYSYHAAAYGAQGGAAHPLTSQMGCFPFFRIEGHLGQLIGDAIPAIEAAIAANNLPFVVQAMFLGREKSQVVRKPGIRYSDLHRLHQILRTDLASQLEDAKTFSTHYTGEVNKLTADDVDDLPQMKVIAGQKDLAISGGVASAKTVLSQSYPQYKVNAAAWKPQVEKTITAAAEFKQNLGPVTKTEFTTPFDSLISSSHIHWLDWLDIIIRDKGDKEDALLLFPNFQAAHPGLEHFAGVVRGGTFILVFDSTKRVVGDFMLPYHCCEVAPEIEPQEPVLPLPPIKTPGVIRGGIKVIPTADKYFSRKLTQYTQNVIDPKINYQKEFVKSYTDSLTSVVDVLGRTGAVTSGFPQTQVADPVLNASMVVTEAKRRQLDLLKGLAVDPAVPVAQRTQYTALMRNAEAELAKSIQDTVKYVSDARLDVSPGSEAFHAVSVVSAGIAKISHEPTINSMNTALTELRNNTANTGLKNMLGGIVPS